MGIDAFIGRRYIYLSKNNIFKRCRGLRPQVGNIRSRPADPVKAQILDDRIFGAHVVNAQQLIGLNRDVLEKDVVYVGAAAPFVVCADDIERRIGVANRDV